jgi:hypothetical protein
LLKSTRSLVLKPAHVDSLIQCPLFVAVAIAIQIPHSLYRDGGYEHREALFGVPPYGGSIAQNLYYADDELCDPNVDTTKGFPQRDGKEPWQAPFILMLDRGGCTFVKKVSNVGNGYVGPRALVSSFFKRLIFLTR